MPKGLICKAISGFYYVESGGRTYACRAKGAFRNQHIKPLVGDWALFTPEGEGGRVEEILPRKHSFIRPPVANIDQFFFVVSACSPAPNLFVLDKLISIAEYKGVEPVIVLTKLDMEEADRIAAIYQKAGFPVLRVDYRSSGWRAPLERCLQGKVSAFCGNSGVGKSTLINHLGFTPEIETGEISDKLGRGRHTTRQVELYPLPFGGYLADTPGFSDVQLHRQEQILKDQLPYTFREMVPYLDGCQFTGCSHTCEKGCAVLAAVAAGEIPPSRHESYCALYEAVKDIAPWELEGGKKS